MSESPQPFRCPFEQKGIADKKIITVGFKADRNERLKTWHRAFSEFRQDTSLVGLQFLFPRSLREQISTFEELESALLPYWCELLGVELNFRLYPFLPYQPYHTVDPEALTDLQCIYLAIASAVFESIEHYTGNGPRSVIDIIDWIQAGLNEALNAGMAPPGLALYDPERRTSIPLAELGPGTVLLTCDRAIDSTNPDLNGNLFGIVKCPLYPPEFGRYSNRIEIVYSREAHFNSLPKPLRRQIRTASNTVLQQAGVSIQDLEEDRQNSGLWIPNR